MKMITCPKCQSPNVFVSETGVGWDPNLFVAAGEIWNLPMNGKPTCARIVGTLKTTSPTTTVCKRSRMVVGRMAQGTIDNTCTMIACG